MTSIDLLLVSVPACHPQGAFQVKGVQIQHIIIIIIIISCYPFRDIGRQKKRRHLILFLASFLTSPQLFPFSNASLWTDLRVLTFHIPIFVILFMPKVVNLETVWFLPVDVSLIA